MAGRNQELKFEIINQIGVISTSASGWNVELNRVSWNGNEPKYDVRSWSPDHTKMGERNYVLRRRTCCIIRAFSKGS